MDLEPNPRFFTAPADTARAIHAAVLAERAACAAIAKAHDFSVMSSTAADVRAAQIAAAIMARSPE